MKNKNFREADKDASFVLTATTTITGDMALKALYRRAQARYGLFLESKEFVHLESAHEDYKQLLIKDPTNKAVLLLLLLVLLFLLL